MAGHRSETDIAMPDANVQQMLESSECLISTVVYGTCGGIIGIAGDAIVGAAALPKLGLSAGKSSRYVLTCSAHYGLQGAALITVGEGGHFVLKSLCGGSVGLLTRPACLPDARPGQLLSALPLQDSTGNFGGRQCARLVRPPHAGFAHSRL
jgi:hypothetical protein